MLESGEVTVAAFEIRVTQTPVVARHVHRVAVVSHTSRLGEDLSPQPIARSKIITARISFGRPHLATALVKARVRVQRHMREPAAEVAQDGSSHAEPAPEPRAEEIVAKALTRLPQLEAARDDPRHHDQRVLGRAVDVL